MYDDFVEAPAELFADLFSFLGVDAGFEIDVTQWHNVSRSPRSRAVGRILREGNILTRFVGRLVSKSVRGEIKGMIGALNEKPKPVLSPEDRARFRREYREDVLQLEGLLGRSLEEWRDEGAEV